ncbi:MAG: hypothetical protein ACLU38_14915 [Dysosmobacter sp.]
MRHGAAVHGAEDHRPGVGREARDIRRKLFVMVEGVNDPQSRRVIYNLLENATKFAAPTHPPYLGLAVLGKRPRSRVRNVGQTIPSAEEIPCCLSALPQVRQIRGEDKGRLRAGPVRGKRPSLSPAHK